MCNSLTYDFKILWNGAVDHSRNSTPLTCESNYFLLPELDVCFCIIMFAHCLDLPFCIVHNSSETVSLPMQRRYYDRRRTILLHRTCGWPIVWTTPSLSAIWQSVTSRKMWYIDIVLYLCDKDIQFASLPPPGKCGMSFKRIQVRTLSLQLKSVKQIIIIITSCQWDHCCRFYFYEHGDKEIDSAWCFLKQPELHLQYLVQFFWLIWVEWRYQVWRNLSIHGTVLTCSTLSANFFYWNCYIGVALNAQDMGYHSCTWGCRLCNQRSKQSLIHSTSSTSIHWEKFRLQNGTKLTRQKI